MVLRYDLLRQVVVAILFNGFVRQNEANTLSDDYQAAAPLLLGHCPVGQDCSCWPVHDIRSKT